jgi:tetratricopeptide (TPR) repeat protein
MSAASIRRSQQDYAGALPLLREQLALRRQEAVGDDPPAGDMPAAINWARGLLGVAHTLLLVAMTEDDLNRPQRADQSYRETIAIYRRIITRLPEAGLQTELLGVMTRVESRNVLTADDRQWLESARGDDVFIRCRNERNTYLPEAVISGCTGLIESGELTQEQLVGAFGRRGNVYYSQRDYVRAIADFAEIIRLDPQNALAFVSRGNAYLAQRDYALAIADYNEAARLDPQNSLAFYNRALAYRDQRDYTRAISDMDQAATLDPDNAGYQNSRCWYRAMANRDLDVARAACDASLRLRPGDASAHNSRGMVGLKQERWQDAWNDYDAAARAAPDRAGNFYGRGIAALRLGRIAEGEADIAHAATLDANIAQTYAGYGVTP